MSSGINIVIFFSMSSEDIEMINYSLTPPLILPTASAPARSLSIKERIARLEEISEEKLKKLLDLLETNPTATEVIKELQVEIDRMTSLIKTVKEADKKDLNEKLLAKIVKLKSSWPKFYENKPGLFLNLFFNICETNALPPKVTL